MKKQLSFAFLIALTVILAVGVASASDVNVTDSNHMNSIDDSISVDNYALSATNEVVVDSVDSNNLSNPDKEFSADTVLTNDRPIEQSVSSENLTKYYKGSESHKATFYDNEGNPLANTQISFTIKCSSFTKTYNKLTDANGVASIGIGLNPGTYQIISSNPVTGYDLTTTCAVLSTIDATDITKVAADARKFYATFLKADGSALANTDVKFKVNGKTYTAKTNANGVAGLSVSFLKAGNYKIISYNIDGLTKTNNIKVISSTTSQLITNNYTFSDTEKKIIKVTLLNGLGYAPNAGKTIKLTINGVTYSAKTDSNGVASFTLPDTLAAGKYTAKYTFAGNSYYSPSSATDTVIIKEGNSELTVTSPTKFVKGAGESLKVTLTSEGVPLAGKNVVFKLGTKEYVRVTDSNGVASLPIGLNIGKYTFYFQFAGEGDISPCSASVQIEVVAVPMRDSEITVTSPTTFKKGAGESLKVTLTSEGVPLAGKNVVFKLGTKEYVRVTDSNGVASLPIGLNIGKYTFYFSFAGEGNIAPCSTSVQIEVIDKASSVSIEEILTAAEELKALIDAKQPIPDTIKVGGFSYSNAQFLYMMSEAVRNINAGKTSQDVIPIAVKAPENPRSDYRQGVLSTTDYVDIANRLSNFMVNYKQAPNYASTKIGDMGHNALVELFASILSDYKATGELPNPIIVGKNITSQLTVSSGTTFIKEGGQPFKVTLTGEGLPLAGKEVIFKIGSSTYNKITDSNGVATLAIELKYVGEYNVTFEYAGEIGIYPCSGSVIIKVVDTPSTAVSISDILTAAEKLKEIIDAQQQIPETITVGDKTFTNAQFLYLMTEAVKYIYAGETTKDIEPITVKAPSNPSSSYNYGTIETEEYIDIANRLSNYMVNNKQAPNYVKSDLGNLEHGISLELFACILSDYKAKGVLPSTIIMDDEIYPASDTPASELSIKNIILGANKIKAYYATYHKLPNTVTVAGSTFKLVDFIYLMTHAIGQIESGNFSDISVITNITEPANKTAGDYFDSVSLSKTNYLKLAANIEKCILDYNKAPGYASSTIGKICYLEYVDALARILAYYGNNNALPSAVVIDYPDPTVVPSPAGKGLNQKNTETDLTKYLIPTMNCQVDNAKIKTIVAKVTAGLTSVKEQATAIYNYVRDYIHYAFYYDTKHGAVGTLEVGSGNCVDQAHLLVAMLRTADIPARYVHGTCTFSSGSTYGHVWVQVLVGDIWYVIDPTSSRNSFGKIANWNTNTFTLHTITNEITF